MPMFDPSVDYYAILQVHPQAHQEVVKRAYHTLLGVLQAHPVLEAVTRMPCGSTRRIVCSPIRRCARRMMRHGAGHPHRLPRRPSHLATRCLSALPTRGTCIPWSVPVVGRGIACARRHITSTADDVTPRWRWNKRTTLPTIIRSLRSRSLRYRMTACDGSMKCACRGCASRQADDCTVCTARMTVSMSTCRCRTAVRTAAAEGGMPCAFSAVVSAGITFAPRTCMPGRTGSSPSALPATGRTGTPGCERHPLRWFFDLAAASWLGMWLSSHR